MKQQLHHESPHGTSPTVDYETLEVRQMRETGSFSKFYRAHDSFCRTVLNWAIEEPVRLPEVKAIFPFFRLGSVLRIERTLNNFGPWLTAATYAGLRLALRSPDIAAEVMRSDGDEVAVSLGRLKSVMRALRNHPPTLGNMLSVFRQIARQWQDVETSQLESTLASACRNAILMGMTATVARNDPELAAVVERMIELSDKDLRSPSVLALMDSLAAAAGQPAPIIMAHPLLAIARAYYPNRPIERDAILPYFAKQLRTLHIESEEDCPSRFENLVRWVDSGVRYGRQFSDQKRSQLSRVYKSLGRTAVRSVAGLVQEVVNRAGSLNPLCLTASILQWQVDTLGWSNSETYGLQLEDVVRFADFAVWIGWVGDTPFATRSKREASSELAISG